ncbi:pyrimidine-specific ribonucleoside hydrolase RihA-like [Odontomachus brunneus]|uniref:pyrimidine-specific ribonucleoside hydrolase RihA-like n=1 Tax=Odontomachus brunneus TaxID=486640 RepID=UPI0013F1BBFA|nr:pyrimidine-specific ribonucleoside hydrolase RihA-like [Odontomachus brunneus]XP_032678211.1 pyrimidine-specific ribonucleoside hydrolase RihA-like [Odontomachus brunneus]
MKMSKIIIDCDAGTDDALALYLLLVAHKEGRVYIEAVTCVFGNTTVDNVVKNVYRVLELFEDYDIPVYKGAYSPLMNNNSDGFLSDKDYVHGLDGFGDVYTNEPDINRMRMAHAAYALQKHTTDNLNDISIVCLGPLTNIALTIKLYPDFASNIKDIFIMGGNCTGHGNIKSHAEFNFYCDPESASIVLNNISKPIYMLPWETCLKSRITDDWRWKTLGSINTPFVEMLNKIEEGCLRIKKEKKTQYYVVCDAILAGIVLRPEMARNTYSRYVDVELNGSKTRGQVVIDHLQERKANVFLIDDFDSEILKELLHFVANPDEKNNEVLFPQILTTPTSHVLLNRDQSEDSVYDQLEVDLL